MARTAELLVTAVFVIYHVTNGFNLEPRLPIIKQGEKGSYFGYTVAEHLVLDENTKRVSERLLLIGAPRAQTSQPGTNHSGAIYRCGLSTYLKDCEQLQVDQDTKEPDADVIKDDQWLGVSLKSQGAGGFVMTCAHRYIENGSDFQWGKGICYSLTQSLDFKGVWEPCLNRPVTKAHEQYGYCQAGTSADISEDLDIVIGAPGPYTWRGTVFTNHIRFGFRDDRTWYAGAVVEEESPVDKYSYLGMSVASGRFFGTNTSFVAGAPRSNGTGQVVIYTKQKPSSTLLVQSILSGEQFASSFGYTLAALDINSDGLSDLVVGAPFYFARGEGGAAYVYMNSYEGGIRENTVPMKLTGKPESRFSFALASCGDLNQDGYLDLAVGAPYEGSGVVYIYLGSAKGLIKEPSQTLTVGDIPKIESRTRRRVTTFGYSLAGGLDVDGNNYPDLLVGAYESDTAILFRSRPIIDIVTSVKGQLTNIDPNSEGCADDPDSKSVCFSFEACFQFNSSVARLNPTLRLRYRIEAETFTGRKYYRVKFRSSETSDQQPNIVENELVLRGASLSDSHCSKELVYLKDKTDIQNPIRFKLTYSLIQKEPKQPNEGERLPDIDNFPILNQQEASRIFEAKFLKDCGEDEICESDLHVEADLNLPKEDGDVPILYLGEEHVNMSVRVVNTGDPAYDATFYVFHPSSMSYVARKVLKGQQAECIPYNSTLLKCDLGNPFTAGEVQVQIRFDQRKILDGESSLKFIIKANTTSHELTPEPDLHVVADIIRMAELELLGNSYPEQVFYGGKPMGESAMVYEDDVGSHVVHTYTLINHGPYFAKRVEVVISWPYEVANKDEHGKWLLYMIEEPQVQRGKGYCDIKQGQYNPLGLTENPELKLPIKREEDNNSFDNPPHETRKKREVIVLAEELRKDGESVKVVTMDCERGTAKCFQFRCYINNLNQTQDSTSIKIRARLWNSTLVEDYPTVNWVSIISRAHIELSPILDIKQRTDNDYAMAETKAQPDVRLYQTVEDVPLWIIIIAVIGGLVLLIILIIILWRLGFFKRKKPGYELANTRDEKEANNF